MELQYLFDELKIKVSEEQPAKKAVLPLKGKKQKNGGVSSEGKIQEAIESDDDIVTNLKECQFQWQRILRPYAKKTGISMGLFLKKLVSHFQAQFKLYLPKDILKQCKCPQQLIEYFGKTPFILKPSIIRNDDEMDNNPNLFGKTTPLYMYLPIFVMNRVPSDVYRVRNPMLRIKKDKKTGVKYIVPNEGTSGNNLNCSEPG